MKGKGGKGGKGGSGGKSRSGGGSVVVTKSKVSRLGEACVASLARPLTTVVFVTGT